MRRLGNPNSQQIPQSTIRARIHPKLAMSAGATFWSREATIFLTSEMGGWTNFWRTTSILLKKRSVESWI
jgi:hypothetical protein